MSLNKAYYLLYYKLYRFFESIDNYNMGLYDLKAGVVIESIQIFIVLTIGIQIEVITTYSVLSKVDLSLWILLPIALAFINYYSFNHKERWKKFEKEFKTYSKPKTTLINYVVLLFCILILGFLVFSLYQLSLIHHRNL